MLLLIAGSAAYISGVFVEASNTKPRDLIMSKITDISVHLEWTTPIESQGYIEYGTNPSTLTFIAPEANAGTSHALDIGPLQPATTYYFHIKIGDQIYDDLGKPWSFVTKPAGYNDVLPVQLQQTCPFTTCDEIQSNLGNGCEMSDYLRVGCVK
jgi:hypothetical protein